MLVKELLEDGSKDEATIIAEVVDAAGVSEATVQKDIEAIQNPEEQKPKAKSDPFKIKVELSDKEKANAEIAKGRVTEYEVPEKEREDTVHVELETVQMNADFEKTSKPYIQKFDTRAWNNFRQQAKKLGINHVRVLYAPKGVNVEVTDPVTTETKTK